MEKERGGERWHDTGAEAQRACTWFLCSWHRFWNSPSARNAILVGWYTVKCTITAVSLKPRPATTFVTALHFDPIASSCRNVEQHFGDGGAAIPSAFSCPCHDLSRPYPTPKRHSRNLTSSRLTCVNFHRSYLASTTLINIHLLPASRRFLTIFTMRGMLDNNVDSFLFLKRFKLEIVYGC